MKHIGRVLTLIALTLLGIGAWPAAAQESVLYSFAGGPTDGSRPEAGLISDAQGNLYGTTTQGGEYGNGAVFELSPKEGGGWTETLLWSFDQGTEGSNPLGSLVLDKDGNLYGTLSSGGPSGGSGTVFELSPGAGGAWTEKTLFVFGTNSTSGAQPQANLIFDSEGNLYGTTKAGTGTGGYGVVFELSPSTDPFWTEKVLHTFPGTSADGCYPTGGLIFDAKGNLYGTASSCGSSGAFGGAAFELSPGTGGTWTETVLWNFGVIQGDGKGPLAALVFDAEGNLYGTTYQGGPNPPNGGVVFELSPEGGGKNGAWSEKVLWGFAGGPSDGQTPYDTLILDAQGNLYGTTIHGGPNGYAVQGCYCGGTVFELSPATGGAWTENILYSFEATGAAGFNPWDGLAADSAGNLYGTTGDDASNFYQNGTVFEMAAAGFPAFSPAAGAYVGTQSVTITSTTTDAVIYYTTNGTTPTTSSTKYIDPIEVSASETIKAFASLAGYPNSAVASAAYTILVRPTVGLTLSSSDITTEQALTVTVAVSGTSGDPTPTGSVILTSGSYTSAAATLSGGSATITVPARSLAAGDDTLTVSYTPNSASSLIYADAAGTGSVTVTKVTPTVALTLSSSSITTEQVLTVTVAVNGGSGNPAPAGSVTLASGTYTSASATLTSGSATISIPAGSLAVGSDTLTASYAPNSASSSSYNAATGTGSVTVRKITPTVTVTASAKTITTKQALTVTVVVNGGSGNPAPTGSVTLASGAYTSAAATLASGSATISIPAGTLPLGSDTLTVSYMPNSASSSSYSSATGTASLTVTTPITPTVTVTPSASGITTVQALTVTIAVNGGSGNATPTGSVSLTSGAYTSAAATLSGGSATIVIPAGSLAAGTAALTVTYTPDSSSSPIYNGATGSASVKVTAPVTNGLLFIPVTPCRIVDTRNAVGAFGGPELAATSTRTFNVPQSGCSIPSTAVAYSLNATVVPDGELGYLTVYPAGVAQPNVSTLNSDGRVKANATITPAGTSGGVSVYASNATNFILDIDGYFVPAGSNASGLEFFPVTPCRIADTRNATGPLGGPSMAATTTRAFPVLSSSCRIPSTAKAYSLNITAVPHGGLGYLSAWPTGEAQPLVSTLNASTGAVTANAAIVPAGTSGEVSIYVSNDADAILDINGYFAPPATGGLSLYTVTPCRVIDTRNGAGAFNGTLTVSVETSSCAPPSTAKAYVLNATVIPTVPAVGLGYLSLWPAGAAQPLVSTLNASDAAITSNMAIVPTNNGSVDAYASNPTQLLLDLASYFAP